MSLLALAFLLVAAMIHAVWNALLKGAHEKYIAIWGALVVGTVCFLPVLLNAPAFPAPVWLYMLSSVIVEALYFGILASAYRDGDFSLVYPIARGTAPALLAFWAVLFLGERLTEHGAAGLTLLVSGLVVTGSSVFFHQPQGRTTLRSILLALAVALCISFYSVIDGAAVRLVHPAPYTVFIFGLTALLLTPLVFQRYGYQALLMEFRRHWLRIGIVGCFMLGGYMLVLLAYTVAPVSYAGAIREVSVVFGALIGWLWFRERFGPTRLIGAIVIFAGIFVIAMSK